MKVLTGSASEWSDLIDPTAITIGNFDGVHRGHRRLIKELVDSASERSLSPVVLTFSPHPQEVIEGKRRPHLCSLDEKISEIAKLEVETLVVQDFSREFADRSPEDFLRHFLFKKFNPHYILFGYDFRFGKKGAGDFSTLQEAVKGSKIDVRSALPEKNQSEIISSSQIRDFLRVGDLQKASQFLGRAYSISGKVVAGDRIGRTLGFPTANLNAFDYFLPPRGVYFGYSVVSGQSYRAVTNIGVRPTLDGTSKLRIESHLLDFDGELYGKKVTFSFCGKIRDELKFNSLEELRNQIAKDIEFAEHQASWN